MAVAEQPFFDLAGVMLVALGRDGRVTRCNRRACEVLGCTPEQAVGADWVSTFVPSRLREPVRATFERLIAGELPPLEHYENPVLRLDGEERLVAWHNALLTDAAGTIVGTLSSGEDVTERRRAERALRESEQRFRTLFEGAQDGMLVAEATTRRIIQANRAACQMFGCTAQELTRLTVADLHPADALPHVVATFERQLREPGLAAELPIRRRDGASLAVEINSAPLVLDGQPCLLGIFRDVSERNALHEQMLHSQKLESLGVLAGGIAHDFNNLLVAILGQAELALTELPTGTARNLVTGITSASQRAAELCRQLLAYSGRGKFALDSVQVNDLVEEMAALVFVSVSKKAELSHDLAADLPPVVADATQLRQLLLNLMTNASEALGGQPGKVQVRTSVLDVGREVLSQSYLHDELELGRYVSIEVIDTGSGMTPETIKRLFDPFFSTKFSGRGLGLAAALGIVRSHHGAIRVASTPGEGSAFQVLLPAAPSAARARDVTDEPPDWAGGGEALVVDDDATARLVTSRMLEHLGFSVFAAEDGAAAVEICRARGLTLRCVILDLTMPKMDGIETFRQIKTLCPELPVVLCSGYHEADLSKRFRDEGFVGFLQKPYRMSDFRNKLGQVLAARDHATAPTPRNG